MTEVDGFRKTLKVTSIDAFFQFAMHNIPYFELWKEKWNEIDFGAINKTVCFTAVRSCIAGAAVSFALNRVK